MACPTHRQPFTFSEKQFAFLVTQSQTSVLMIRVFGLWLKSLLQRFSQNGRWLVPVSFASMPQKIEKCLEPRNGGSSFYFSHQCFKSVKSKFWSGPALNVPWLTHACKESLKEKHFLCICLFILLSALQLTFAYYLLWIKHFVGIGAAEVVGKYK